MANSARHPSHSSSNFGPYYISLHNVIILIIRALFQKLAQISPLRNVHREKRAIFETQTKEVINEGVRPKKGHSIIGRRKQYD